MSKRKYILQILFLLTIISEIVKAQPEFDPSDILSTDLPTESDDERAIRLCGETQPLKGIKEECYQGENNSSEETCCYMTVKYETSQHIECISVKKDLGSIKSKIDEIKKTHEGSKSISIDCNSFLIRITLISFLLFLIF